MIILNQLLRWRRRSQRVRVQFTGLATFLPTKALTLEMKCDHGLIGHRPDQSRPDLNVLDRYSPLSDEPFVPLLCNDWKGRQSPAALTARQWSRQTSDSHGPLGTDRSLADLAALALFLFIRSVRERSA